ncbi:MAG TPA: hypothetical protein VIK73_03835 [Limnochordales bacterium]
MRSNDLRRWALATLLAAATALAAVPAAAAPVAGGGWELAYQQVDVSALNDAVGSKYPSLRGSMLIFGGGGMGPLPVGDGSWTLGGFGAGGQEEHAEGGKLTRLALGYGGVRVGYARPLTERLTFDAGLGLAVGGMTLTVVEHAPSSVEEGLNEPGEATFNRLLVLVMPEAGLTLSLTPVTHLRLAAGYTYDPGLGAWHNIVGTNIGHDPAVRASGLRVGLSLVFGAELEMGDDGSAAY